MRRSAQFSISWHKSRKLNCRLWLEKSSGTSQRLDTPIAHNALHWSDCAAPANQRSGKCWHLHCPFIELDRIVEDDYGASIPDLIEMAGTATFRRQERSALDRIVTINKTAVITTAGGIVSNPETYSLLLRCTHTVWIKARPDDHMSRVMAQGDFRPMARNREAKANEAMADLVAILEARRADYARAEAELDTSGDTIEQSFGKLLRLVSPWLRQEGES
jgi:shikimate kinase